MRTALPLILLLSACSAPSPEPAANETADIPVPSGPPLVQQAEEEVPDTALDGAPRWESATGDGGTGLRFVGRSGALEMSIACMEAPKRLVVSVPSLTPIGSEERFSLALGEEPVTLVADPTRQKQGVIAAGAVPGNFGDLLQGAKEIGAMYGNQRIGPHPAPPKSLVHSLAQQCAQ
jgi:hypothetical protein